MQQIADIAERGWLDSWPGTMKEEAEGQLDSKETYEMMTGMCKDEEVEELDL